MQYEYQVGQVTYVVTDTETTKTCEASDGSFHYTFDKITGDFMRWGKTEDDDPLFCPAGPEILDLEISVNGCPNACQFCYKGSTNEPATNMTFETFKAILDNMPKTLTQVAFGITGVQTNPDFLKMMHYSREMGVVPNFTLSGIDLTDEIAFEVSKVCGALAVSAYETDKNVCYDTIYKFTQLGMDQVNMHIMVSEETYDFVLQVLRDRLFDHRLRKMNAIVFLGVKPKGRAKDAYTPLSSAKYTDLISLCLMSRIAFGFDSCSAPKFEAAVDALNLEDARATELKQMSESCESSAFSSYINVLGEYWNCSFSEEVDGIKPVNVLTANDFLQDVWYHENIVEFREKLMSTTYNGCRHCPVYPEINGTV